LATTDSRPLSRLTIKHRDRDSSGTPVEANPPFPRVGARGLSESFGARRQFHGDLVGRAVWSITKGIAAGQVLQMLQFSLKGMANPALKPSALPGRSASSGRVHATGSQASHRPRAGVISRNPGGPRARPLRQPGRRRNGVAGSRNASPNLPWRRLAPSTAAGPDRSLGVSTAGPGACVRREGRPYQQEGVTGVVSGRITDDFP
jgi:hypothetical protein